MMPLTVLKTFDCIGTQTMKVSGFTEAELADLNAMYYQEMKKAVLDELDKRNGGLGTRWHNGYGVYHMWIKDNAVYVEIGNSCD